MDFRAASLGPECSVREAVAAIDAGHKGIAFVVAPDGRLLGTVADGDVRRAILRGLPLEARVTEAMKADPVTVRVGDSKARIRQVMEDLLVRHLPVLDADGRLVDVLLHHELVAIRPLMNPVVIMAGGKGSRLRPLTEETPKPLLPIGDRPIIEILIEHLEANGLRDITIAVNYKADDIRARIGDGSRMGVRVSYVQESQALGTAGALRLVPLVRPEPVIVLNADLLTKVDLRGLLDYHRAGGYAMTLCVRRHRVEVPFGVIELDGQRIVEIEEKPSHDCLINAGIYVVDRAALGSIPSAERYDMTDLVRRLIGEGKAVGSFPIHEYWLDIGRMQDYRQAVADYKEHFKASVPVPGAPRRRRSRRA